MNTSVHVKARNLTVAFPLRRAGIRTTGAREEHKALNKVSFTLKAGARVGLLGRNGSGKSTLLRTLAGVYPPTGGKLDVRGKVAAIFNASLGFVQDATGIENIYLRGAMLGLSFAEIKALLPGIVEFSELGDWVHEPIHRYSSGMALRLAFSITTAVRSDILLLDEWLGAGDAAFLRKARARMRGMVQDASIVVLATHNLNLMRSQCNQAMVLEEGKLVFFGDLDTAIEKYQEFRQLTQL
ncbi:MAG: ABC transporter ATP-binding protein [Glycocaulis sp.]